ncbi:MAG: GH25 family lysozyme [Clostridiales bacterium]|nr:GH25 family lysozyme [Clostridiales bacterium]
MFCKCRKKAGFWKRAVSISMAVLTFVSGIAVNDVTSAQVCYAASKENSFRFTNGENRENPVTDKPETEQEDLFSIQASEPSQPAVTSPYGWKKYEGTYYNNEGKPITNAIALGIDVSKHNKTIDWEQVKEDGVDFAILRCGYGMDLESQDDSTFLYNAQECTRLGIPFGVYLYSYADTTAKAKSEADHVLRLISGFSLSYPVYYDLEDKTVSKAGKNQILKNTKTFCSKIEAAGYPVGIYASKYWFDNYLVDPYYYNYEKWVAQYNSTCTYTKSYVMWQGTSVGKVAGVNGNVDINFRMRTSPAQPVLEEPVVSGPGISLSWNKIVGATSYEILKTNMNTGETETLTVPGQLNCSFADDISDGGNYSYAVRAVRTDNQVTMTSTWSFEKTASYEKPVPDPLEKPEEITGTSVDYQSVKLNWSKVDGADGYRIYRKKEGEKWKAVKTINNGETLTYTNTGLECGTLYYYTVRAYQNYEEKKILGMVDLKGIGVTPVVPVTAKVTVKNNQDGVFVRWKSVKGADGYIIYRKIPGQKYIKCKTISAPSLTWLDTKTDSGVTYYYKVKAYSMIDGKKKYGVCNQAGAKIERR